MAKKEKSEPDSPKTANTGESESGSIEEPEISEDYVAKGAKDVTDEDVKKVVDEGDKILKFVIKVPAFKTVAAEIKTLLALVQDYWYGRYTAISRKSIAIIAFSLLYLINPIDIIPDIIPGIGFLDDLAVILLCLRMIKTEMDKYKLWREAQQEEAKVGE